MNEETQGQNAQLEDFHKDKLPIWKLMYSAVVAGKSAEFAFGVMSRLDELRDNIPIEDYFEIYDYEVICRQIRTGNYTKMKKCWEGVVSWFKSKEGTPINWEEVTPEEIEEIHGIGPKTSRFFLMWVNPKAKFAALDTHILKWLASKGHTVPRSTPNGKKYLELEKVFLKEAESRNLTPVQLDWKIWDSYANKKEMVL